MHLESFILRNLHVCAWMSYSSIFNANGGMSLMELHMVALSFVETLWMIVLALRFDGDCVLSLSLVSI